MGYKFIIFVRGGHAIVIILLGRQMIQRGE